jgi:hypothetical protein
MYKQHLDCKTVLAQLRKRRAVVAPNPGFLRQLEIYGDCDYDLSSEKGRKACEDWRVARDLGYAKRIEELMSE